MADYLEECFKDAKNSTDVDASVEDFKATFCATCMNTSCKQSKWRDSSWEQRMDRQEKMINNPEFADPSDPKFANISAQHFVSVEEAKQDQNYGGWVELDGDGKVVHKADPPTEEKTNRNVDRSQEVLNALKKGEDPPPQKEEEPQEEQDEKQEQDPDPPPKEQKEKDPDQSGKVLGQGREPEPERPSVLESTPQKDDWAIDEGGDDDDGGSLTVRIDTGEKAD